MTNVMKGVRVLEVAQFWFVPSAGAVLADWGANVLKIEHPERGDAQRGLASAGVSVVAGRVDFLVQQPNRGKRSIGIDIAHSAGRELLYRLAETCDVFLTNFLPDTRRKLQIDVEHIRARNPRIIYARGHAYGARGPEAENGGYDATAFWTRGGIAAALFYRERTGEAQVVDVSLLGTAMWVMSPDIVASKLINQPQLPIGPRATRPNPAVNNYRTKDGRWLILVHLQADRYWPDLWRRLGRPDLATDPRFADMIARAKNSTVCIDELDAVFATRTLEDWRHALAGMEGPWAVMQTPRELHDYPRVAANEYLGEVDGSGRGRFTLVANPVQFGETPPTLRRGPEMGEHTDEVLHELGLTDDELMHHKVAGAIH